MNNLSEEKIILENYEDDNCKYRIVKGGELLSKDKYSLEIWSEKGYWYPTGKPYKRKGDVIRYLLPDTCKKGTLDEMRF